MQFQKSNPNIRVPSRANEINCSQKADRLLKLYTKRLNALITTFYKEVGDDETANEALYESFDMAWKKTCNAVNNTQKAVFMDPFAFSKTIEEYKQIALSKVINAQENGSISEPAPTANG